MTARRLLAIESSCDETAAAVVDEDLTVVSSVVSSQIDLHAAFGGVVPEVAGRAHVELLEPVVAQAIEMAGGTMTEPGIVGVAVTRGPGLIGSLLVGLSGAKAMAWAWGVPLIGINHMEGHLFAAQLEAPQVPHPHVVAEGEQGQAQTRAHSDREANGGRFRVQKPQAEVEGGGDKQGGEAFVRNVVGEAEVRRQEPGQQQSDDLTPGLFGKQLAQA